ncbi:MAG TPA: creatininase family protein, partial [Chthonomonadales bacterium]|nr:creatininase family protein [Chthonomonadales bacterium]
GFCGTMTLQNDRYIGVVEDLLESALESGFRRILLLNGHGGNEAPARIAMYNVRFRRRAERGLHLALVSWWSLIPGAAPVRAGCVQAAVSHACEWETSALLALHPESVRADLAPDDSGPEPWPGAGTRRYVADEARQFAEVTVTGALGLPRQASASKGEALLSAAADALVELVRDISGWADTPQPHH